MQGLEQALRGGEILAATLNHAPPSEVARQIVRGDALEAAQPVLQSADVGVNILDVIAAVRALALAGVEGDVEKPLVIGERLNMAS